MTAFNISSVIPLLIVAGSYERQLQTQLQKIQEMDSLLHTDKILIHQYK